MRQSRGAPRLRRGAAERWGAWGAMSGPSTTTDEPSQARLQRDRAAAAQGRCLGQGHRRYEVRGRPRPAPYGLRQAPAQSPRARPHPAHRHHAGQGPARGLCRDHRRGSAAGQVRDPAGVPGRGSALSGQGPDGRRCRRRGGRHRRGDRGAGHRAHRGRLRAAARLDVDRGLAGPPRGTHPRVRRRAQRPQGGRAPVRRRAGGPGRRRPGPGGRVLLRGEHPPADGAARGRGPVGTPTASSRCGRRRRPRTTSIGCWPRSSTCRPPTSG